MMFAERSIDVDQVDEYEARPFPVVDLVTVALAGIPEPKRLFNGLLYAGALHSLAGPPDSGKTFLAYRAALQELREGNRVVVLDEENGREVVTEKLLDLGATPRRAGPPHLRRVTWSAMGYSRLGRAGPTPGLNPADPGDHRLSWYLHGRRWQG
jgi:AAA domain